VFETIGARSIKTRPNNSTISIFQPAPLLQGVLYVSFTANHVLGAYTVKMDNYAKLEKVGEGEW
jgi:hypothetical protein